MEVTASTLLGNFPEQINTDKMETVKSYDGEQDVNIKSYQEGLKLWPSKMKPYLSDTGKAGLAYGVYQQSKCGCKVKGNGTLQFPMSVEHCEKHNPDE